MPARCRSIARACISPRASGRCVSPIPGATSPPRSTRISSPPRISVERGGLVAPGIGDTHLPDARGEMQALAIDLQRAGIHAIAFSKKFHVGELDTLARLVKASLLKSEEPANAGQCLV